MPGFHTVLLTTAALALLWLPAVSPGATSAPLSAEERQLVLATVQAEQAVPRARRATHPLGAQTLSIEIDPGKRRAGRGERVARVYRFDHATNSAYRLSVALPSGALLERVAIASPHLPLNAAERAWAHDRLAATGRLGGSVSHSAFVFEPQRKEDACAVYRCALFSLYDATGAVMAEEWIVDFSDGSVRVLSVESP